MLEHASLRDTGLRSWATGSIVEARHRFLPIDMKAVVQMTRLRVWVGSSMLAVAVASSLVAAAGATESDPEPGIPDDLPPASSLGECVGLPVTLVAGAGQQVEGTDGNDVVALDPKGSYSPNGGTDLICDGFGRVQSISIPEGEKVPQTSEDIAELIQELGGET